jgi:predicted HAD superfamily phosphohydrolase YqeG
MKQLVAESRNETTIDITRWLTSMTSNNMTMMLTNNRWPRNALGHIDRSIP